MKIRSYGITAERGLVPCEYGPASGADRAPGTVILIDLEGGDTAEFAALLDELEIRGLAKRLCLESRDRPGFLPLKNETFVVLPIRVAKVNPRDVEHRALIARSDLLLIMGDETTSTVQNALTVEESNSWLADASIPGLVAAFMITRSLESLQNTVELRNILVAMENRMDRDPYSVEIDEIARRRSEVLALDSVVSGQLPILHTLLATDSAEWRSAAIRPSLLCAAANLDTADRTLRWLEGRVDVMRSLVDVYSGEMMNRRLGRLTVLSMIFMPITLMAGIWGMNFEGMPELTLRFGYPIALGAMTSIGAATFFYFRRRGWFN